MNRNVSGFVQQQPLDRGVMKSCGYIRKVETEDDGNTDLSFDVQELGNTSERASRESELSIEPSDNDAESYGHDDDDFDIDNPGRNDE